MQSKNGPYCKTLCCCFIEVSFLFLLRVREPSSLKFIGVSGAIVRANVISEPFWFLNRDCKWTGGPSSLGAGGLYWGAFTGPKSGLVFSTGGF